MHYVLLSDVTGDSALSLNQGFKVELAGRVRQPCMFVVFGYMGPKKGFIVVVVNCWEILRFVS